MKALWSGPEWADPVRPREQWVAFPDGMDSAGVTAAVAELYPDVQWFEGPSNEPNPASGSTITEMAAFHAAVKAGNPAAKVIGPCPVNISTGAFRTFLANGGGDYCDGFSFHDYNSTGNGSLTIGRSTIDRFLALLSEFGQEGEPLWQTEAGASMSSVYGVFHPRRARVKILHTLLWEQYGVPAERNVRWYDKSHGYWAVPMFMRFNDSSVSPEFAIHRTLAEETYGRVYTGRLSFGRLGDTILLGNVYVGPSGKTVALCATSHMPGLTVTLETDAVSPVTVIDAFGNESTVAIMSGRLTLPVGDVPTYVELPPGTSVAAYSVGSWPAIDSMAQSASSAGRALVDGSSSEKVHAVNDGAWMSIYDGSWSGAYVGADGMPDALTLRWDGWVRGDRVVIWSAQAWQAGSALVDFDVQTSDDGSAWTTRATVTKDSSTSFLHGTSASNAGCQRETFWDEQWIFDVPFTGGAVDFKHLRIYVRETSYGGEPDVGATVSGGQGYPSQRITVQEVVVLCDANVKKQFLVTSAAS
jgi:hypothetical protein